MMLFDIVEPEPEVALPFVYSQNLFTHPISTHSPERLLPKGQKCV